jgi:ribosome recycling factor
MNEEVQFVFDSTKEMMQKSVDHLEKELLHIRAGRANPEMLNSVRVDYYGAMTPLHQVANVNTPDARTITVQPWEKKLLHEIERAIINANLGFNPMNNGDVIIINVPVLTEDRRKDLIKQAKNEAEHARVGIRNSRKDANDEIKKLEKDGLSEDLAKDAMGKIQALTDAYIKKVDEHLDRKEKEIMVV